MTQPQYIHEGTAQELFPYLVQHPKRRFRLIELSTEEEELVVEGHPEEKKDLKQAIAELIEAAKHVEREEPVPLTDPHEIAVSEALQEKYRKMGLHR